MKRSLLAGVGAFLILGAFSYPSPSATTAKLVAIKSVHLINLSEGLSEDDLMAAIRHLNRAIHSTGHLDAGYILWKVRDPEEESPTSIRRDYIMEGIWPTQAAYDEIHQSGAFKEAAEEVSETIEEIHEVQLYSRYTQMAVEGPGEGG